MPACQALLASKQKQDPDEYDADAADSSTGSSDGSDGESQDQEIDDEIRGQDIPSQPQPRAPDSLPLFGHEVPIPPVEATMAMPTHPAPETTPGPSSGSPSNSLPASLSLPGPSEGDSA